MAEALPNYIRLYRRRHCLSQDELAVLLGGTSGSKIARYETNERIPPLQTALMLAAALETPVEELFLGLLEDAAVDVKWNARELLKDLEDASPSPMNLRKWQLVDALANGDTPTIHVPEENTLD